jgi:uncharacterized membrane protein
MTVLIIGVLVWSLVHLIPTIEQPLKKAMTDRLGENGYKGVFALLILVSVVMIVIGWRSTPEEFVYVLPPWSRTAGFVLMVIAFLLIGAAHHPTRIKRFLRHPMLAGTFLWGVSHLLTNGTTRALILFGGIGLWALIEIPLINRREGLYIKPDRPSFSEEIKGFFISGLILIVVLLLHPYFAGVTPFPR